MAGKKIAIDLGSGTTRVLVPKKGIVLEQPTVIAKDETIDKIVAIGDEALEMAGRLPEQITVIRPFKSGVIADYGASTTLLHDFIQKAVGRLQIKKPEAMLTVSGSATSTERRALIDAGKESGLQSVYLIRNSIASALGAGLPITEARGNFVIDIGAGTTEIGVFSLGGIVTHTALRYGGDAFDDAIRRFMRREHGMVIGTDEVNRIKKEFISMQSDATKTTNVHGRNTIQGLPKTTSIKLNHLQPYMESALERIIIATRRVLEQTPPDLISDIIKHGIVLTGGGSQLNGLPEYLSKKLKVAFVVAQDPELSSIYGAEVALTHLDDYKRSLLS